MKAIENHDDVHLLVVQFYAKIRADELLGPIFNGMIPDDKWPGHLDKLTDFWITNLFGIQKFKGNPVQAHVNTDKAVNHSISQVHFGRWLQLWFETIDTYFEGKRADKAKSAARRMASGQFMVMWHARPNTSN